LRAQIARISASTTLNFKGQYKYVEESNERDIEVNAPEEGELVKPTVAAMKDIGMWVHETPSILMQGRAKHAEPLIVDDEDPQVAMDREVAKDPWEKRLKPVSNDATVLGGLPAWVVRAHDI